MVRPQWAQPGEDLALGNRQRRQTRDQSRIQGPAATTRRSASSLPPSAHAHAAVRGRLPAGTGSRKRRSAPRGQRPVDVGWIVRSASRKPPSGCHTTRVAVVEAGVGGVAAPSSARQHLVREVVELRGVERAPEGRAVLGPPSS